ncbi:hypothetical protein N0V90_010844 [Kalmusia sp. IMI 367209]|nr:hypothetical protein N0V90_010844 [Kalmusia sp. IMI 367209]
MPDFFKRTESLGGAMQPPTPQEAAPAYDDVIHLHGQPANNFASSSSGYASIPQNDIENDAPAHNHTASTPVPQETLAQTIAGVFRPKPHVHCEECDKQAERRERRAAERHCCAMVAWVFIVLFICGMILGIVVANTAAARARRGHHD